MDASVYVCEICFETFDSADHKPLFLTCGHTFGQLCVKQLEDPNGTKCPRCRHVLSLPVDKLTVNYSLIPSGITTTREHYEESSSVDRCVNHQYALDHFCVDCGRIVCRKCTKQLHANHRVEFMEDILRKHPDVADFTRALESEIETRVHRLTVSLSVPSKILALLEEVHKCKEDFSQWKEELHNRKASAVHYLEAWKDCEVISKEEKNELFKALCAHWRQTLHLLPDGRKLSNFKTRLEELNASVTLIEEVVQEESAALLRREILNPITASPIAQPSSGIDHESLNDIKKSPAGIKKSTDDIKKSPAGIKESTDDIKKYPDGIKKSTDDIKKYPDGIKKSTDDIKKSPAGIKKSTDDIKKYPDGIKESTDDIKESPCDIKETPSPANAPQNFTVALENIPNALPNISGAQTDTSGVPLNTTRPSPSIVELLPDGRDWAVDTDLQVDLALASIRTGRRPSRIGVMSWPKSPLKRLPAVLAVFGDACIGDVRVTPMDSFWKSSENTDVRLQTFIRNHGHKVRLFYGSPADVLAVSGARRRGKLSLGVRLADLTDIDRSAALGTRIECVCCMRSLQSTAGRRMLQYKWTPEYWHFAHMQEGDVDWLYSVVKPFMPTGSILLGRRLFQCFLPGCGLSTKSFRHLLEKHPKFPLALYCESTHLTEKEQTELSAFAKKKGICLKWTIHLREFF